MVESLDLLKELKIKKQHYKFEIRKKYFNKKKYNIRKKQPIDILLKEIRKYLPSKERSGRTKKNLIVLFTVLILIGLSIVMLFFSSSQPKDGAQTQIFKPPTLEIDIKEAGITNIGGYVKELKTAYYKLEYRVSGSDLLKVNTSIYDENVPNQIFILSSKGYETTAYSQFKENLEKKLAEKGFSLNTITIDQFETLPKGCLVVIPSGYMPEKLLEQGDTHILEMLKRGVHILYIGNRFDSKGFVIDEMGNNKRISSETASALGFVFEAQNLKPTLYLRSGLYSVKRGNVADLLYNVVSVVRTDAKGVLLVIPQRLEDGWNKHNESADDVEKIITEMQWINARVTKEEILYDKENKTYIVTILSPSLEEKKATVLVRVLASNRTAETEKMAVLFPRSDVNGDLYLREDMNKIVSGKISGEETEFIINFNETDTEPRELFFLIKDIFNKNVHYSQIQNPRGGGSKISLLSSPQFKETLNLNKGIYLASIVDKQDRSYAKASIEIVDIEFKVVSEDYTTEIFKFAALSDGVPINVRNLKIVFDKKYNFYFQRGSEFEINLKEVLGGIALSEGAHTFDFEIGEIKKQIVINKVISKGFWDNPVIWVLGGLAGLIFLSIPLIAFLMQKAQYSLDIPDFPPLASIKIPIKKANVLEIFERVNEDYKWKNMPLKPEEIKKGFKKIIYQNRPVFISDYNLEYLLENLKHDGKVKKALNYYGLTKWEAEHKKSIAYLAMYRKVRDICINEAIPFTKLDESKECDINLKVFGQDVFIYLMDGSSVSVYEKKLAAALKTIKKGVSILLFIGDKEKQDFKDTINTNTESSGLINMEIMANSIIPLDITELEKMLKEMKTVL